MTPACFAPAPVVTQHLAVVARKDDEGAVQLATLSHQVNEAARLPVDILDLRGIVATDALVRLTIGGPPVQKRGEMLHSYVRYFDLDRKQPGLPEDVANAALWLASDESGYTTGLTLTTDAGVTTGASVQGGAFQEYAPMIREAGKTGIDPV